MTDLAFNIRELSRGKLQHVPAAGPIAVGQGEELTDLLERKAEFLGAPDEPDALDHLGVILSVAGLPARGFADQRPPFVIADRFHVDRRPTRHLPDR